MMRRGASTRAASQGSLPNAVVLAMMTPPKFRQWWGVGLRNHVTCRSSGGRGAGETTRYFLWTGLGFTIR